jgi:hypothetical protein
MIPKLFAFHAVMFAMVMVFVLKTDLSSRQPSSVGPASSLDRLMKY